MVLDTHDYETRRGIQLGKILMQTLIQEKAQTKIYQKLRLKKKKIKI